MTDNAMKVGDLAKINYDFHNVTIGKDYRINRVLGSQCEITDDYGDRFTFHHTYLDVVPQPSTQTDAPTIWRDMTDAEKAEILLADHRGEELQAWVHDDRWEEKRNCFPYRDNRAYRVKPKAPKVETLEAKRHIFTVGGNLRSDYGHSSGQRCLANITHTYTITDGRVTACDTIIHD